MRSDRFRPFGGRVSLRGEKKTTFRLGTAGLRPQTRAQAEVAPLLRNGLGWRGEFVSGGTSSCLEPSLEDPLSILAKFCNLVQPFSGFGKLYGLVGTFDGFTPQKIYILPKALEIYKLIFCTLIKDSRQNTACIALPANTTAFIPQ